MPENMKPSRRRFLKIGPAMILAGAASSSNAEVIFKRTSPASRELVEVGLILGNGGQSNGIWGRLLNPPSGEVRRTGMIFTKVWSADPTVAENFRKRFGVEIVKSFDSMAGKVHAMFVDDFFAAAYDYKLAQPYLEAGIPTVIRCPQADSMVKARDMVNRARKGGAPLMTGSDWEHLKEVHTVRSKVKPEEITGYEAWNSSADFYSHGVHGLWLAYAAIGGGIQSVSFRTKDWRTGVNPHDPERSGITRVLYKDRGRGSFTGKINEGQMPGIGGNNCALVIQPGNQTFINHWADEWARDEFEWLPMLHRIQRMFETGEMYQTYDEILEKTALFIAAFYSHLEKKGEMVPLDVLPEDWAIGSPYRDAKSKEYIEPYIKLFGKERGVIQPI
ncbi:MAG: Gfo/Idh/MocA family oxidoreductase [Candidatus Latescibacterota bacterium]